MYLLDHWANLYLFANRISLNHRLASVSYVALYVYDADSIKYMKIPRNNHNHETQPTEEPIEGQIKENINSPYGINGTNTELQQIILFVLRFYGPVNPMGSSRARSVYLTTLLLGRLSPLSG